MAMNPQYETWINEEWREGRLTRPGAALTQLEANPRNFLSRYPIRGILDPAASGPTDAYIMNSNGGKRPGSILRTKRMHATETFQIQAGAGASGEGVAFRVHGVRTTSASVDKDWYTLDATGPALMMTAKLTGCTFIARAGAAAGSVQVTHVQPDDLVNGLDLCAREIGVAGQHCYGRTRYDISTRSINIIGIRSTAGIWKIYAQKIEKHALSIRSVTRIYP